MKWFPVSFCVAGLILVAGCSHLPFGKTPRENALAIAQSHGFQRQYLQAEPFEITVFHKGLVERRGHLRVYIEGDGRAWTRRRRISKDPTPAHPMALELAVQDPSAAVLYIARPCQFTRASKAGACHPKYWASHRSAPEVIHALSEVIDQALAMAVDAPAGSEVELIGYSGGGPVAALIAARRKDVRWLLTAAANLDHQLWTRYHGDSAMSGSLNARDVAADLRELPQLHLVGDDDPVVPVAVLESYQAAAGGLSRLEVIKGYSHRCCWKQEWLLRLCRSGLPGTASNCPGP